MEGEVFSGKGVKKFQAGRNLIFLVSKQVDKIGLIDIGI